MKNTFATCLKSAMERAHMNQSELSMKTGIGKSSISQYLSGTNAPTKGEKISTLAEALGVTTEFLLGLETATPDAPSLGNMKIGLKAAARCMRKSEAFLREGLINGKFPFGTAVQGTGCRVNSYINPEKFRDYVGAERFDQFFNTVA